MCKNNLPKSKTAINETSFHIYSIERSTFEAIIVQIRNGDMKQHVKHLTNDWDLALAHIRCSWKNASSETWNIQRQRHHESDRAGYSNFFSLAAASFLTYLRRYRMADRALTFASRTVWEYILKVSHHSTHETLQPNIEFICLYKFSVSWSWLFSMLCWFKLFTFYILSISLTVSPYRP